MVGKPLQISQIWSQAKRSGKFEDQLKEHDESGDLEKNQMDKLGLRKKAVKPIRLMV